MKKLAFTLAETLITLGIIGVVAAITIPTLISNYQKHVYYTQFMKARSTIENALRLYAADHDCPTNEPLCNPENAIIEEFSRYFKGATLFNDTNYKEVCKGYDILPATETSYGTADAASMCMKDIEVYQNTKYNGFITNDLLISMQTDAGYGGGAFVDVNGPYSGPNKGGRDIFSIYPNKLQYFCGHLWGATKECLGEELGIDICDREIDDMCGERLIKEGKMTY